MLSYETYKTLKFAPQVYPSNQTLTNNPHLQTQFEGLPLTTNPQIGRKTLNKFDYPKDDRKQKRSSLYIYIYSFSSTYVLAKHNSSICFSSTTLGASVIRQLASLTLGNAITSLMLSQPVMSIISLSRPNASPA